MLVMNASNICCMLYEQHMMKWTYKYIVVTRYDTVYFQGEKSHYFSLCQTRCIYVSDNEKYLVLIYNKWLEWIDNNSPLFWR